MDHHPYRAAVDAMYECDRKHRHRPGSGERRNALSGEGGQVLPLLAVGMLALVGLSAVAVDTARHAFVATDLQNAADAAAAAGAQAATNGSSAYTAAQTLAQQNKVNGLAVSLAVGDVLSGRYSSGTFTAGATPTNAVRVTTRATFANILSGMLGSPVSTITRTATASVVPPGSGMATIPMALGDNFWNAWISGGRTGALPPILNQPNNTDNAGWTTFFDGNIGTSSVTAYFPSPCGGGSTLPLVKIGDNIRVKNGQASNLNDLRCMVCVQHINRFIVPLVHVTGNFIQTQPVTGFATIVVSGFGYSGKGGETWDPATQSCVGSQQGSLKSVDLQAIYSADALGTPTDSSHYFGTGFIQLVG